MGKNQSKSVGLYRKRDYTEGECFVVNAHFNPLGIDDEETLLKTKSSTATSEITLSLNSCQSGDRVGFADDKYPLKVVLPPETGAGGLGVESHVKGGSQWETTTTTPNYVNSQNEDKTTKSNHRMKNISGGIQGFECDVSVEADFSGKQKREFVFTLYDLDGDGQITKDDITGLVRSMYEALGTSLKLPPSGSRTIRVRLTMSPGKKSGEKKKSSGECPTYQDKYSSVDKEIKRAASEVEKNEDDQQQPQEAGGEKDNENVDEEDEDDDEEGETEEEDVKTPVQKHYLLSHCMRKMPHRSKRREMTTALTRPSVHRSKTHRSTQGHRSASPCGRRRTRVSFSKEQQLLEIIQSNLEKKKGCGQCQGQNQRKRSSNVEGTPRQYHVRRMRSDCFRCECVVDSCHDNGRACPYQNVNTSNGYPPKGETGFQCPKTRAHHHHTRSHSHDLTDYYQQQQQMVEDNLNHLRVEDILLKDVRTVHEKMDWFGQFINQRKNPGVHQQQHQHTRSKSYDPQQCCKVACNLMTFTPTCKLRLDSGFGYLSSHHHKHRHREEDHQRAMEQVACWIEKEHSGLRGSCIPPSSADQHQQPQQQPHTHHHHSHQEDNGEADGKKSSTVPVVERHEHHHIHQHYHHHYHHYHQL